MPSKVFVCTMLAGEEPGDVGSRAVQYHRKSSCREKTSARSSKCGQILIELNAKNAFKVLQFEVAMREILSILRLRDESCGKMTGSRQFPILTAPWTRYQSEAEPRNINGLSVMITLSQVLL
jgi:hypothetical protein